MLNLLPPLYKKELETEERFRLVLIVGLLFVLFLVCLSLLLLAVRLSIAGEIQAKQILLELQLQEKEGVPIEEIRNLNEDLRTLSSFYQESISVVEIIGQLIKHLPESISFKSFTYAKEARGANVSVRGFAPRRESLLEFQENLEQDPFFSQVNFPPANLFRAIDVDFSFTLELQ